MAFVINEALDFSVFDSSSVISSYRSARNRKLTPIWVGFILVGFIFVIYFIIIYLGTDLYIHYRDAHYAPLLSTLSIYFIFKNNILLIACNTCNK